MNDFPIRHSGGETIPYRIIAPHEKQALRSHQRTLQRLAENGGLTWGEAWLVLNDEPIGSSFFGKTDPAYWREKVMALVAEAQRVEGERTLQYGPSLVISLEHMVNGKPARAVRQISLEMWQIHREKMSRVIAGEIDTMLAELAQTPRPL